MSESCSWAFCLAASSETAIQQRNRAAFFPIMTGGGRGLEQSGPAVKEIPNYCMNCILTYSKSFTADGSNFDGFDSCYERHCSLNRRFCFF
jgi:hypothetical protein